ncbi:MAG: hypothetical protein L3J74_13320 [Bacteroidales bacterium]|nr:hypothetical protein [Bacteroidales bacterium]
MKYYVLNQSNNIKEMGVLPQSEESYSVDIQQEFIPFEGSIDFNFELTEPKLEKRVNCTSLIDAAMIPSRFLIIDDSFLALIMKSTFEVTFLP